MFALDFEVMVDRSPDWCSSSVTPADLSVTSIVGRPLLSVTCSERIHISHFTLIKWFLLGYKCSRQIHSHWTQSNTNSLHFSSQLFSFVVFFSDLNGSLVSTLQKTIHMASIKIWDHWKHMGPLYHSRLMFWTTVCGDVFLSTTYLSAIFWNKS